MHQPERVPARAPGAVQPLADALPQRAGPRADLPRARAGHQDRRSLLHGAGVLRAEDPHLGDLAVQRQRRRQPQVHPVADPLGRGKRALS